MLYSSKTHDLGARPQKVKISGFREATHFSKNLFFCPFKLTRQFMKMRGSYLNDAEPFFLFRDRSPVKPIHMQNTLRKKLKSLNIDATLYRTNSLRTGRTSDLIKYGYTIEQVKLVGRWKSNIVYKYIRN